jgi:hypothetical protein
MPTLAQPAPVTPVPGFHSISTPDPVPVGDPYAPKPIDPTLTYPIRGPLYLVPDRPPLPRDLTDLVARKGAAPVLEVLELLAGLTPWKRCKHPGGCIGWTRGDYCPQHRP